VRFSSRPQHYRPNFHSPVTFEKSWGYAKDVYTGFVDLEKPYDRVPREKLWGVVREYGDDGRLLLAGKSLYSCSDVCVHVGNVKSRPFAVGAGLRQGCVLSLLFKVHVNWIDIHSRVDEGVTVGSCRINHLIFRTIWYR